jgi:hypothetical protein
VDSAVAAALSKLKPEVEDAGEKDDLGIEEEPSLADILASIASLIKKLKKKNELL